MLSLRRLRRGHIRHVGPNVLTSFDPRGLRNDILASRIAQAWFAICHLTSAGLLSYATIFRNLPLAMMIRSPFVSISMSYSEYEYRLRCFSPNDGSSAVVIYSNVEGKDKVQVGR